MFVNVINWPSLSISVDCPRLRIVVGSFLTQTTDVHLNSPADRVTRGAAYRTSLLIPVTRLAVITTWSNTSNYFKTLLLHLMLLVLWRCLPWCWRRCKVEPELSVTRVNIYPQHCDSLGSPEHRDLPPRSTRLCNIWMKTKIFSSCSRDEWAQVRFPMKCCFHQSLSLVFWQELRVYST